MVNNYTGDYWQLLKDAADPEELKDLRQVEKDYDKDISKRKLPKHYVRQRQAYLKVKFGDDWESHE